MSHSLQHEARRELGCRCTFEHQREVRFVGVAELETEHSNGMPSAVVENVAQRDDARIEPTSDEQSVTPGQIPDTFDDESGALHRTVREGS